MKGKNFNIPAEKCRVLVAPLDWGLGHATRCIPVIFKLLEQGCEVIIAAEGAVKFLLEKEFPGLAFIELSGYRVRYSRSKWLMPAKLLLQFPALAYRIYSENKWLKLVVEEHKIDAVISDNRMGLYHKRIPAVYITHQLQIKTGSRFTDRLLQKIHYHFINKFTSCWVPDAEGEINLAGELAHPAVLPAIPVVYIGALSRFEKKQSVLRYDLCILLSGPEPQRTVFEEIILEELHAFSGPVILIRGLPGNETMPPIHNTNIEVKNHLAAAELNTILLQSKIIICRSGYTSIMDLVKLQKNAILVPTPGQTEQEYLAIYLQQQKLFCSLQQHLLSLEAVKKAAGFAFAEIDFPLNNYEKVIQDLVQPLQNRINKTGIYIPS